MSSRINVDPIVPAIIKTTLGMRVACHNLYQSSTRIALNRTSSTDYMVDLHFWWSPYTDIREM